MKLFSFLKEMGQHVLSNLQKLKVMNMSCMTSSANVCVWCCLSGGWLVQAVPYSVQLAPPSQARPGHLAVTIWSGFPVEVSQVQKLY